jgi:molybdopterin/thiamine biosynthesis adenylyltransferase
MLDDNEFIRFSRQLSIPEISEEGQVRLKNKNVLIVGCGGLGNFVSQYLIGAGVGKLVIADGDTVELTNLHRQLAFRESDVTRPKAQVLKRYLEIRNSNARVVAIDSILKGQRLELEVMMSDIVVDCTDSFASRYEINSACILHNKPLVSGATIGWQGHVVMLNSSDHAPCYECLYPSEFSPKQNNNCSSKGALGPIVGLTASMQALETMKYLLGINKNSYGMLQIFDGLNLCWQSYQLFKNPSCKGCGQ